MNRDPGWRTPLSPFLCQYGKQSINRSYTIMPYFLYILFIVMLQTTGCKTTNSLKKATILRKIKQQESPYSLRHRLAAMDNTPYFCHWTYLWCWNHFAAILLPFCRHFAAILSCTASLFWTWIRGGSNFLQHNSGGSIFFNVYKCLKNGHSMHIIRCFGLIMSFVRGGQFFLHRL